MDLILKYFPELSDVQKQQLKALQALYEDWNLKINVISRKDINSLYLKHVLHSLAIAKIISFEPGSSILDVGTGGGFPGIPLAIMFPETTFHLVDSIQKKIKVVSSISDALALENVSAEHCRAEQIDPLYDFVVSRAVTSMPNFVKWVRKNIKKKSEHSLKNGILYLKGGDLKAELQTFPNAAIYNLKDHFSDSFFDTKKLVHLPLKFRG
ncbi:MAG: 16S rRNA (guanine(527)-N(7))-methyltransferase RsmG [Flavobacteriaceae bacterium]|nr:16S rRNA (guanine(527)-N(7))-methyltransferase RsmG [Flavobacteriaceae bacterium]|tara:strand:- start:344 stop:973 length:630 start_codon:yes stop_codon:yes gene_type:complete